METLIPTPNPMPDAPFSPGMRAGGLIFVAGQVPLDGAGNLVGENDVTKQTEQVLQNVAGVLEAAGASLSDVVSVNSYLTDRAELRNYNATYARIFDGHKPPRVTVIATLARPEYLVEISCIAVDPAWPTTGGLHT